MANRHHKRKQNQWKYILLIGVVAISIILFTSCGSSNPPTGTSGDGESGQETRSSQTDASDQSSANDSLIESGNSENMESTSSQTVKDELEEQLVDTPDATSSDWNLVLVNRLNQLEEDIDFEPYYTANGRMIDSRIAEAYEKMIEDGQMQGLQFLLISSYRNIARQQEIYDSVYQSNISKGFSAEEAVKETEEYIALPHASEHSTGLAVDITEPVLDNNGDGLVVEFEDTAEGKWLHEYAADYGFILRYPQGKEPITMIEYESWHFRYVGVENAHYIKQNNLTLEEYVEILKKNEEIHELINKENE